MLLAQVLGLRDELFSILNMNEDSYSKNLTYDDIKNIQEILIKYCNADNVKNSNLSTIWDNINEVCHMRRQTAQLQMVIDCLEQKFSLEDLVNIAAVWQDVTIDQYKIDEIFESPPEDLAVEFEFYDSY